ncbi:hypothetical protein [Gemmatimonas sp.]|uniref:hypothetical protein n=1 Tax=Gemmatimonas sp. TaxID=1962908 RepID=UPI0025BFF4D1|nr:hypothetical protein [Gemmatimonas sp.]MCA2992095.1 hypothetical protein [Gemmatimonas sp.]
MRRHPASPSYSRRCRVLALLDAAADALGDRGAAAWLHRDHPALLGLTPVAAAWAGEGTADFAFTLLAREAHTRRRWSSYLGARQRL